MAETTIAVRERPILFSGEMVSALLEGTKTQTRRLVLPQPRNPQVLGVSPVWGYGVHRNGEHAGRFMLHAAFDDAGVRVDRYLPCPYGAPGDQLWVREALYIDLMPYDRGPLPKAKPADLDPLSVYYRADGECCEQIPECSCREVGKPRWRPSIHMPRWASRLSLQITEVRVERLQDISEADAQAEGAPTSVRVEIQHPLKVSRTLGFATMNCTHREAYHDLWDRLNAARGFGWDANPWCWCITFRRVDQ